MEYIIPGELLCMFWDRFYKVPSSTLDLYNKRYMTKFKSVHMLVFHLYVDRGFGIRRCMYWTGLSDFKVQIILSNVLNKNEIRRCLRCHKQIKSKFFCKLCVKRMNEDE